MSHNGDADGPLESIAPGIFQPSVTAFRSEKDLYVLRKWFYESNDEGQDMRHRALQRVRALSSRGKIPHAVEMTSLLTSTTLQDERGEIDPLALQLSYSMALIRFVNGLLDPYQQGAYAIPLHSLAKSIGVPNYFVEIRHMGTHESLPTLAILRIASSKALAWLFDSYWTKIEDCDFSDTERILDTAVYDAAIDIYGADAETRYIQSIGGQIKHKIKATLICDNLEFYKKMLKTNIDKKLPFFATKGASGPMMKFTQAVEKIVQTSSIPPFLGDDHRSDFTLFTGMDLVINVLLFNNFMLYNKDKAQGATKFNAMLLRLYEPLLDHLGPTFKITLFESICQSLVQYCALDLNRTIRSRVAKLVGFLAQSDYEAMELMEWAGFLLVEADDKVTKEGYFRGLLITQLESLNERCNLPDVCIKSLVKNLKKCVPRNKRIIALEEKLVHKANAEAFKAPPSLEELLSGSQVNPQKGEEAKPKRRKYATGAFLEEYPNYKTTPFGISP